jgi:hypothetical protein
LQIKFRKEILSFESTDVAKDFIYFHENGRFMQGSLPKARLLNQWGSDLVYQAIGFDPVGNLQFVDQARGSIFVETKSFSIARNSRVNFLQSEEVQDFIAGKKGRIKNSRGEWFEFSKGDLVRIQ